MNVREVFPNLNNINTELSTLNKKELSEIINRIRNTRNIKYYNINEIPELIRGCGALLTPINIEHPDGTKFPAWCMLISGMADFVDYTFVNCVMKGYIFYLASVELRKDAGTLEIPQDVIDAVNKTAEGASGFKLVNETDGLTDSEVLRDLLPETKTEDAEVLKDE